jgi:UDP-N-acetylglucosamine--N-acetylmuramyl-(pentapeptide) pyrophosphoryl-undecaprenol N-acetylglucosamine transferase
LSFSFLLTGGGTGGHVFPALAVAKVLRERGHKLLFAGTKEGMEARLVPEAGYEIEFVPSGKWNRVGLRQQIGTALQLPGSVWSARALLRRFRPHAVFSMGGYVSGPVMLAAVLSRAPLIVMEPNAVPGFANRKIAPYVYRALLGFEATRKWFPAGRSEVTGLPVRAEFFSLRPKEDGPFTVLITGGSRGARTLNRASRESWPLFRARDAGIRIVHQTGAAEHEALAKEFAESGLAGQVVPFLNNMAEAFAHADLVVGRSGAGGVNEIAAARMPSILVPFPFSADDHQTVNARTLEQAGAARMTEDRTFDGERLFREVEDLRQDTAARDRIRERVRQFARPGAAERAASVLEEAAQRKKF